MSQIRRGEVWWVSFDPSIGGEIKKTRPAIVVSNEAANKMMNRVQVVPVSSNIAKLYPCEAYVYPLGQQSKAMADQLATVSKQRFGDRIDALSREEMESVERAIKIQLALS